MHCSLVVDGVVREGSPDRMWGRHEILRFLAIVKIVTIKVLLYNI